MIATGGEGGGHIGAVPTSLLVPQVAAAVDIPVIAAGGFFDGRGLVAALAWGAAGVAMGTRFLLTSDSPVADEVKRLYLAAGLDGTVVTRRVDGVPHRVLRTTMVDHSREGDGWVGWCGRRAMRRRSGEVSGMGWGEMLRQGREMHRESGLGWGQVLMAANTPVLLRAAMVDGRTDLGLMSSGQVTGLIDDLPSCAELIESIMAEAGDTLDRLAGGPRKRRSMIVTLAWPPPSHMVCSPYRPPVRSSSCRSVVISRAPVAPSGWPSAMAPPLT